MKSCSRCKSEKLDSGFYFYKKTGKLSGWCRACHSAYSVARAKMFPERTNAANRRWQQKHRERFKVIQKATNVVAAAIRKGILVRATVCENCGRSGCEIEASHDDYTQLLKVKWLCIKCHRTWDTKAPKSCPPTPTNTAPGGPSN